LNSQPIDHESDALSPLTTTPPSHPK